MKVVVVVVVVVFVVVVVIIVVVVVVVIRRFIRITSIFTFNIYSFIFCLPVIFWK